MVQSEWQKQKRISTDRDIAVVKDKKFNSK